MGSFKRCRSEPRLDWPSSRTVRRNRSWTKVAEISRAATFSGGAGRKRTDSGLERSIFKTTFPARTGEREGAGKFHPNGVLQPIPGAVSNRGGAQGAVARGEQCDVGSRR